MISEKIINYETKYVKDAIYSILKECNINFDNIKLFFQNDLNLPNRIFCVRKEKGWYYYQCDEKFVGYYSGPYDKNALIQMIAMLLPIPEDIITKIEKDFFSKEMEDGNYLDNRIFSTLEEIDQYEQECSYCIYFLPLLNNMILL